MEPASSPPGPALDAPRAGAAPAAATWPHRRFFELLGHLGRLRVISQAGASTFEAICGFGAFGIAQGHMNAITPEYHWHLALERFRHLRSFDAIYPRSGRRVLYFELRERPETEPFLHVFLHREPGAEFEAEREAVFLAAHRELEAGVELRHAAGAAS